MVRRPNFFILGAPKCGTTALAQWLSAHPNVYFCPEKEPHYFNRDGRTVTRTMADYEALFVGAASAHTAIGEGSTHYLYSRTAVPDILVYAPDAKFIVCLRNPVEMAPALHGERVRYGEETVRSFERAWELQGERAEGKHIPLSARADPERLQYGSYCSLGKQTRRLLSLVPRDRVLMIVLDDLGSDTRREYLRVLEFLGLQDDGRMEFPVVNAAKRTRSVAVAFGLRMIHDLKKDIGFEIPWFSPGRVLRQWNVKKEPRPKLPSSMRKKLCKYFEDDISLLEHILDRDLSGWLRV